MPFLAVTLLWILNSDRTPAIWRNKWLSNVLLVICTALFAYLAAQQLVNLGGQLAEFVRGL